MGKFGNPSQSQPRGSRSSKRACLNVIDEIILIHSRKGQRGRNLCRTLLHSFSTQSYSYLNAHDYMNIAKSGL